jgi:hypothetical protein
LLVRDENAVTVSAGEYRVSIW